MTVLNVFLNAFLSHSFSNHFNKIFMMLCFWQAVNRCLTTCLLSQTKITTYSRHSHFPTFHSLYPPSFSHPFTRSTLGPPFLFVYTNSEVSFPLFRSYVNFFATYFVTNFFYLSFLFLSPLLPSHSFTNVRLYGTISSDVFKPWRRSVLRQRKKGGNLTRLWGTWTP